MFLEEKIRMAAATASLKNAARDAPSLRVAEPTSESPSCRMKSMLVFLSSVDYLCSRHLFLSGGSREANLGIRCCLLPRGEAERDNGGCSYDIAQGFLVWIRNHEALRTSFGTKRFYYCVVHARKINQLFHNCTLSPRMSVKLDTYWVVASRIPKRFFAANCRLRCRALLAPKPSQGSVLDVAT